MKPEAGKRILEDMGKQRGKVSDSDLQVSLPATFQEILFAGHSNSLTEVQKLLLKVCKDAQVDK